MHRCRTGEITFIYQGNKRNELVALVSKLSLYIIEKSMSKVTSFGKSSFLGLEPSTMIQTLYNFSPLLMFEFRSIC